MQPADLMHSYPIRFRKEKSDGLALIIHFDLSGRHSTKFTVEIANSNCVVYPTLFGTPNCTIKGDAEHYFQIEKGELNAQTAFIEGLIKVDNPGLMLTFARCFKKLKSENSSKINRAANFSNSVKIEIKNRKPSEGPLQGIRIIDLSRLLPGPMATMLLADMGAEVIKIENPDEPDYIRDYPPKVDGNSAFYMAVNRSKKSFALDTSTLQGKEILYDLIKTADVFIESFRPGILNTQDLGYDKLSKINPKLIYASITGYGQHGPYAFRAGHDINYMGYAGLLSLSGDNNGAPAQPGIQLADIAGGAYMACNGILAAIISAIKTGKGQYIDLAMTDAVMPMAVLSNATYSATGEISKRNKAPLSGGLANYSIYKTKDNKYVALGALEPKFWNRFCAAIDHNDWVGRIIPGIDKHQQLKADLTELFASEPRIYWEKLGSKADCCLSPVLELSELEKDPHLKERNMFVQVDGINGYGQPIKFSDTPAKASWKAPELGEDSVSILDELGYNTEKIDALKKANTIA
ncbi:MAG: alpha-methylacyl-CoA racemase [Limisphaerales bacterium]|jgi:alpha-methylacyl-CoA racemase